MNLFVSGSFSYFLKLKYSPRLYYKLKLNSELNLFISILFVLIALLKAVSLEPGNKEYRANRAILHRRTGNYIDAIGDTMLHRALDLQPSLAQELQMGK